MSRRAKPKITAAFRRLKYLVGSGSKNPKNLFLFGDG